MTYLIAFLAGAAFSGWFGYNLNMSTATARISRALAGDAIETGLQDAITPPLLALNYYACFISAILVYFALGIFGDSNVFVITFAFWLGGVCTPDKFVPNVDSPYWVRIVHRSLRERMARYAHRGKDDRATTMTELASRLEVAFADMLQPMEVPATK